MQNIAFAFLLTLLAGLSTGIGSFIALFAKKTDNRFLSLSLGFSAGVMLYVSMVEISKKAIVLLSGLYGDKNGFLISAASFFGGMLLILFIDTKIPFKPMPEGTDRSLPKLMRTGIMTALAIGIHNFPEGLATFVSALREPSLALPVVAAIAIHNIPEGIAVSVPIHMATGSKKKAFFVSFLSGLTEPLGAGIGYLLLLPFMSDTLYGVLYGVVAGIMVFISLDELFPTSMEYGDVRLSVYGVIMGMAVMAVSLWLFL